MNTRFSDLAPVFYAVFDRIAPAANKYMATLFNTDALAIINVHRVFRFNWQSAGVADDVLDQYLAKITARTVGTSVPVISDDSLEVVPAGLLADTNSTGVTEAHIIRRVPAAGAEFQLDSNLKNLSAFESLAGRIYEAPTGYLGIVLRQNQGISIRNVTALTAGSVSYVFECTQIF